MRKAVFFPMPGNRENSCTASSINLEEKIIALAERSVKIPVLQQLLLLGYQHKVDGSFKILFGSVL
ncbi:MAG: hypothetical protein IAE95_07740 [Chitinophagaceae bacterium]|nr:hypothetical protein [Chitinophagaceae bacterium]